MNVLLDRSIPRELYHVAATALPVGQVLRPYAIAQEGLVALRLVGDALSRGPDAVHELLDGDQWLRLPTPGHYPKEMIVLEAVFERVRLRIAPELPSRYTAVFGWGTVERATRYRVAYYPSGVVHRCELVAGTSVERDGALLVGAFEAADLRKPRAEDLQRVEERAIRYWRGHEPMAFPELLVQGTVVVIGTVDVSAEG